jgi:lysophospholipase L1-like esterase
MRVRGFVLSALVIACSNSATSVDPVVVDSGAATTPDTNVEDTGTAVVEDTFVADTGSAETTTPTMETSGETSGDATIRELCFSKLTKSGTGKGPEYDKFMPTIGSHCFGTNHQEIKGVEKVVFLGDSVTVGTPNVKHALPADNAHFYRNKLAEALASKFSLNKGSLFDWGMWKSYDALNGVGGKLESGDFKNCSKWGARTDDFLAGGNQISKCFPSTAPADKKTLFVFTMGGNDISAITKMGADANEAEVSAGYPTVWAAAKKMIKDLDDAVAWMKDPTRFPKGSYVIMANPFEFTDATGDVSSCPAAGLAGYKDWKKPEAQVDIVVSILEAYMDVAVKRKVDLVWMLESFCGHGYVATKASSPPPDACWLGPGTPLWFDETCIHPNDLGHDAIYRFMNAVVDE